MYRRTSACGIGTSSAAFETRTVMRPVPRCWARIRRNVGPKRPVWTNRRANKKGIDFLAKSISHATRARRWAKPISMPFYVSGLKRVTKGQLYVAALPASGIGRAAMRQNRTAVSSTGIENVGDGVGIEVGVVKQIDEVGAELQFVPFPRQPNFL